MTESASNLPSDATALVAQPLREVERDGVRYTILGTAHVSQASVDAVHEQIAAHDFDAVAIELCESRYQSMRDPDAFAKLDLIRVIREGKVDAVHDVSDGGLLVAVAEMALAGGRGVELFPYEGKLPAHAIWFGEDQGRYVLSADPSTASRACWGL